MLGRNSSSALEPAPRRALELGNHGVGVALKLLLIQERRSHGLVAYDTIAQRISFFAAPLRCAAERPLAGLYARRLEPRPVTGFHDRRSSDPALFVLSLEAFAKLRAPRPEQKRGHLAFGEFVALRLLDEALDHGEA